MINKNEYTPLNKFFEKIYVVSLNKSTDRHEVLKERLKGLNYKLFWGVDGSKLNVDELSENGHYNHKLYNLNRLVKGEPPRNLNLGRIGCALSHVGIYQEIVEKNISLALILEDDLIVDKNRISAFSAAVSELPAEWDLLYLGHYGSNSIFSKKAKIKYALYKFFFLMGLRKYCPKHLRKRYPRPYTENLFHAGSHWGTHAYAVTFQGASKILKYQTPITREADNLLADLCRYELIDAYSLKEHIFFQDDKIESTIVNRKK